jgi:glyoxylase-like metal-dependent hydrolase (beta-lactamase superfamily II)
MQVLKNLHAFIWESMTTNNCNTYLLDGPSRVLIDPGHLNLFDHAQKGLTDLGLQIEDIGLALCTHAHPDHIGAVPLFKNSKVQFAIHETEWQHVQLREKHIQGFTGLGLDKISPDFFIQEGDISINGLDLKVFHTPGHSPGSVCLYWTQQKALFTGDLVFKEGIGRTDLPGGDGAELKESIKKLVNLEIDWLFPGHGNMISGKEEIRSNFNEIENFWFKYI